MASGKRQPSKQKRYSQNKQQRASLQVRKAAANAAPAASSASGAKKPRRWGRAAQAARTEAPRSSPAPAQHDEVDDIDDIEEVGEVVSPAPAGAATDDVHEAEVVEVEVVHEPAAPEPAPTTLLGRLRRPEEVNLPRAATGATATPAPRPAAATPAPAPAASGTRSTPAATSRTTPRPTNVREAAASGKGRAERRVNAQERAALQPPGYRAAITGVMLAVVAAALVLITGVPVNHHGDLYSPDKLLAQWAAPALHAAQRGASTPTDLLHHVSNKDWQTGRSVKRVIAAQWPWSLSVLLPLVGAYLVFRAVKQRQRSAMITRAVWVAVMGGIIVVLLQIWGAALPVLITTMCALFASYQVRKTEMAAASAAAAAAAGDS